MSSQRDHSAGPPWLNWLRRLRADPRFCAHCGKPLEQGESAAFDPTTGARKPLPYVACPSLSVSRYLATAILAALNGPVAAAAPGAAPDRYEAGLAAMYAKYAVNDPPPWRSVQGLIAEMCDEHMDRSGALLGRVRAAAYASLAPDPLAAGEPE